MARNSMNFNASIRLNTKEFQKGVNTIKKSINDLKTSLLSLAGALGAGLGFTQLISNFKNTALQLSVAKNMLENVSHETRTYKKGMEEVNVTISTYKDNMQFLKKLATDYNQDMAQLIQGFAQFTAACQKTNITLEQQKDIYESLTKAAAFYHMSSDRVRDMQNAIVQMVSKGKVAAEELRRQLGNQLPGAFNLMAAALGMTTMQLDDAMRKGKVLAEDALPKFAAMLNTVTQGGNFDSLQLNINKLKNSWYELVEAMNIEGIFNKVVNTTNKGLNTIRDNLTSIKGMIVGLLAGGITFKAGKGIIARGEESIKKFEAELKALDAQVVRFQKKFEKSANIESFSDRVKGFSLMGGKKYQPYGSKFSGRNPAMGISDKELADLTQYYETLRKIDNRYREMGKKSPVPIKNIDKVIFNLKKAGTEFNNLEKKVTIIDKLGAGFKNLGASLLGTLQSMLPMAIISAIIAGLSAVIAKEVEIHKRWKEVRNIVKGYQEDIKASERAVGENEKLLKSYLAIVQDTSIVERKRIIALKEINKLTGSKFTTDALDKTKQAYKDIVKEVGRWIEATKLQAKIQIQAQKQAAAESQIEELRARNTVLASNLKSYKEAKQNALKVGATLDSAIYGSKIYNTQTELDQNVVALAQLQDVAKLAEESLKSLGVTWADLMAESPDGGDGGGGKAKGLQKVYQDYIEDLKELQNKLREKAITEEEFNQEFDKLVLKAYKDAAATGKISLEEVIGKVDKGKALTKMEQWYYDLYVAAKKAAGKILIQGAQDAIEKSIEEGIKEMEDALEKAFEKDAEVSVKVDKLTPDKVPQRKNRSTLFDYNNEQSDILGEEAEASKDWYDALKDVYDEYKDLRGQSAELDAILDDILGKMIKAKNEAKTFEDAMNIAKITEDIKEMQGELRKGIYGGIKDLASTMDRMVKGVESVKKAFEDTDTSGWEKFVAVFDLIANTIDGVMGIIETINTISKLTMSIDSAELALIEAKNKAYRDQISALMGIAAAKKLVAQGNRSVIASEIESTAVAKANTAASSKEAVAGATSSGAKLPFPWNIAAIALGVATVLAALSAGTMKFAKGGIVGGSSYSGDNVLARVNSGEAVLNRQQQSTLFDILNGKKGVGGGGQVEFKIKGDTLVGVLNNHSRIRKG